MVKFIKLLDQVRKDEDGTALLEYAILVGMIVVSAIVFMGPIGTWVALQFSNLCTNISAVNC